MEASLAVFNDQNQKIIEDTNLPITQDYDLWVETVLGEVELQKGKNILRLFVSRGGANLKKIKVSSSSSRAGEAIFSYRIYPNPAKQTLSINYESLNPNTVTFKIYNLNGQLVSNVISKSYVGENNISWNGKDSYGRDLSSGVYFITIDDGKKIIKDKFTLIK